MIPYNTNGDSWTFFTPEGKIVHILDTDKRIWDIKEAVMNNDEESLLKLLAMNVKEYLIDKVEEVVNSVSFGNLKFTTITVGEETKQCVTYKTRELPEVLSNYLFKLYEEGCTNYDHYFKFLDNILNNPSDRARNELYAFLASRHLPITDNGTFIAYKGVNRNMYSINGNPDTRVLSGVVNSAHQILNTPGSTITVVTEDVDSNCHNYCSCGLHVGTWEYASNFGSVVVAVEVNPADVVSVPLDCGCEKCRVSSYKVLQVITGQFSTTDVVVSEDNNVSETNNTPRASSVPVADRINKIGYSNLCSSIDKIIDLHGGETTVRKLTKSIGKKYGLGTTVMDMICVLLYLGYKVDESEEHAGNRTVTK